MNVMIYSSIHTSKVCFQTKGCHKMRLLSRIFGLVLKSKAMYFIFWENVCQWSYLWWKKRTLFLRLSKLNKKAFAFRVLLYVRNFRVTKSARGYVHQTVCSRKIKHTSLFFLTFQEHYLIKYHGNMMIQML